MGGKVGGLRIEPDPGHQLLCPRPSSKQLLHVLIQVTLEIPNVPSSLPDQLLIFYKSRSSKRCEPPYMLFPLLQITEQSYQVYQVLCFIFEFLNMHINNK